MSNLQSQQKVKRDQPSQDPEAPSALAFLPALHVFSCDCIKKSTQRKNSKGTSKKFSRQRKYKSKPYCKHKTELVQNGSMCHQ
jgi:hypothetical protein